jgi:hypothetical protein
LDAADELSWKFWTAEGAMSYDWIVNNPPFSCAPQIIPLAFQHARVGIAMLLRLSFLEPVENRGTWLNQYPPTHLIVLPRISFTGNRKTDSVTCAWMVWRKHDQGTITIAENPKFAQPAVGAKERPANPASTSPPSP